VRQGRVRVRQGHVYVSQTASICTQGRVDVRQGCVDVRVHVSQGRVQLTVSCRAELFLSLRFSKIRVQIRLQSIIVFELKDLGFCRDRRHLQAFAAVIPDGWEAGSSYSATCVYLHLLHLM